MADRSGFLGRMAGVTQLAFALVIGAIASFRPEPGVVPRGLVLFIVFALPGIVGLLGVSRRRPALLVAAGLTSAAGAFIAFSGVTLIFLIPALLFLAGAVRLSIAPPPPASARESWAARIAQGLLAGGIVGLLVGAGASALLVTDAGCWTEFATEAGVRFEPAPYTTGELQVPVGAMSMSCSTGLMSPRGVGLGGLLAGTALGLALIAARRRDPTLGEASGRPPAALAGG